MKVHLQSRRIARLSAVCILAPALSANAVEVTPLLTVQPQQLRRVASIDPRFQSYNVEMAEIVGGNFWKPTVRMGKSRNNQPEASVMVSSVRILTCFSRSLRSIPPTTVCGC